jgi:SET domain-containing protein
MAISHKYLVVKKSTIPGSGNGLFTNKFIPAGTRIIEYKGKVTTWKEANHEDGENGYIYYMKRNHVIDAKPYKSALARYANDARGLTKVKGIKNNCEYIEEGAQVFIHATKDILPGSEILVPYGPEYWEVIRYNKKLAVKAAKVATKVAKVLAKKKKAVPGKTKAAKRSSKAS